MVKKSNATQNIIISILLTTFVTIVFKFIKISVLPTLVGNKDFITILVSISFGLILYIFMTTSAFCIYKNKDDDKNNSYLVYLIGFGVIILSTVIIYYIQKISMQYIGFKISENMGELQEMGGSEEDLTALQTRYQYFYATVMYIFMLIPLAVNIFVSYFTTRFIIKMRVKFLKEKFNLYLSVLISVIVTFILLFSLTYLMANLPIPIGASISQVFVSILMFMVFLAVTFFEINNSFTEEIVLPQEDSLNVVAEDITAQEDTIAQEDITAQEDSLNVVTEDITTQEDSEIKDSNLDFENKNLFEK